LRLFISRLPLSSHYERLTLQPTQARMSPETHHAVA
jgi:hypothetical protein